MKKHLKAVFLVCIVFVPLLVGACYSPPRTQFAKEEVVVNAPFWVVRDAVVRAMDEENILVMTKGASTNASVSGDLLVDVEQYADCGKYHGKRVAGFADMSFVILVRMINKSNTGIQITSSVTITAPDIVLSKGKSLECRSNGRMERELLDAVLEKVR